MEKKNKNEEIQSRREFFKNAAKAALPILGVALLASNPIVAKATETSMDCGYSCSGGCWRSCTSCKDSCRGECVTTCRNTCSTTCSGGCYRVSY